MRISNIEEKGIKFIVARISECLWDYQSDSYKRPALNSGALLWECRYLIKELYSDNITLKTIDPVFEELKYSLRNGEIVSKIDNEGFQACRTMVCEIKETFSGLKKDKRHEVHQRLEKMFSAYFKESLTCVERSLKDFCENPHEKESITRLIGNWLTELVHRGVSHQGLLYIFRQYLRENKELGKEKFLSLIRDTHGKVIDKENQINHTIILKVSYDKWSYLKVLFEALGDERVEVLSELPRLHKEGRSFFEKKHNHTWLKVSVNAIEPHTALIIASQRLNRYFSYVSFENHQSMLNINSKVYVYTEEYEKGKLYSIPSQSVHKKADGSAHELGVLVNNLVSIKKEGKRLSSLIAALKSHHVAMMTKDVHTQLLSIWSALEAVGEDPVTDGSRFEYVANYIVPILAIDYAEEIFSNLLDRIDKKHKEASTIIEDAFGASKSANKLAFFIDKLSDQDDRIHKDILGHLRSENPVTAFRYWNTAKRFSEPNKVLNEMERHEKRVYWQLARIYRLRNSIVHQNKAMFTVPIVTEHAHSYLDKVIRYILNTMVDCPYETTTYSAMLRLQDQYNKHKELLRKSKKDVKLSKYVLRKNINTEYGDKYAPTS